MRRTYKPRGHGRVDDRKANAALFNHRVRQSLLTVATPKMLALLRSMAETRETVNRLLDAAADSGDETISRVDLIALVQEFGRDANEIIREIEEPVGRMT